MDDMNKYIGQLLAQWFYTSTLNNKSRKTEKKTRTLKKTIKNRTKQIV
jgi:hypothetical protein